MIRLLNRSYGLDMLLPLLAAAACAAPAPAADRPPNVVLVYDDYLGLPYSNDMWPKHPTNRTFPDLPLIDGERVVQTNPDLDTLTARYTERAVAFIRRNKDRPFFLYIPHTMPHVPLGASERYRGKATAGLYR